MRATKGFSRVIRDNNIMSSVASTLVAFGLLLAFVLGDQIALMEYLQGDQQRYYGYCCLGLCHHSAGCGLPVPKILLLDVKESSLIGLWIAHFAVACSQYRAGASMVVVLPEYPLRIWFTYLSLKIILSQIPFLPNKDLIFISAGLGGSELMNVTPAGLAGLLGTQGVLEKGTNLANHHQNLPRFQRL